MASTLTKITTQSSGLTTATTAYSSGDELGAKMTFAGAASANGKGGYLTGVTLSDVNDIMGSADLILFHTNPGATGGDNAALSIADADTRNICAYVQLAGSFDVGGSRILVAHDLRIPYICPAGTSLYGLLVARSGLAGSGFFAAATDLECTLYLEVDA